MASPRLSAASYQSYGTCREHGTVCKEERGTRVSPLFLGMGNAYDLYLVLCIAPRLTKKKQRCLAVSILKGIYNYTCKQSVACT